MIAAGASFAQTDASAASTKSPKTSPVEEYATSLLQGLRYPWPAVADHAAEALVALKLDNTVGAVVKMLDEADPTKERPVVVQAASGLGRVVLVAFDLETGPFTDWPGQKAFWQKLQLLIENQEYFRTVMVAYADGDRYPHLQRDESKAVAVPGYTPPEEGRGQWPSALNQEVRGMVLKGTANVEGREKRLEETFIMIQLP